MRRSRILSRPLACAFAAALTVASAASAGVLFDVSSHDGVTNRDASFSPLTFIDSVSQDVTISSISVLNDLSTAGALRYVVFDASTNGLLYASDAQTVADDGTGLSWKTSDSFLFTLLAGHEYLIGAIADVSAAWAYDDQPSGHSENGLDAAGSNGNASDFAHPHVAGGGTRLIPLRLDAPITAVPELNSLAMLLAGLGALGWMGRRRQVAWL